MCILVQVQCLLDCAFGVIGQRCEFLPRQPAGSFIPVAVTRLGPYLSPHDGARECDRDAVIGSLRQDDLTHIKKLATLNPQACLLFEFPLRSLFQALPRLKLAARNAPLNRSRIGVIVRNEQDSAVSYGRYRYADPDGRRTPVPASTHPVTL